MYLHFKNWMCLHLTMFVVKLFFVHLKKRKTPSHMHVMVPVNWIYSTCWLTLFSNIVQVFAVISSTAKKQKNKSLLTNICLILRLQILFVLFCMIRQKKLPLRWYSSTHFWNCQWGMAVSIVKQKVTWNNNIFYLRESKEIWSLITRQKHLRHFFFAVSSSLPFGIVTVRFPCDFCKSL